MEHHLYRVKDRHDRAIDYLNNSEAYSKRRLRRGVAVFIVLFTIIQLLT